MDADEFRLYFLCVLSIRVVQGLALCLCVCLGFFLHRAFIDLKGFLCFSLVIVLALYLLLYDIDVSWGGRRGIYLHMVPGCAGFVVGLYRPRCSPSIYGLQLYVIRLYTDHHFR